MLSIVSLNLLTSVYIKDKQRACSSCSLKMQSVTAVDMFFYGKLSCFTAVLCFHCSCSYFKALPPQCCTDLPLLPLTVLR